MGSEEKESKKDSDKKIGARKFLKHVMLAAKRQEERSNAREDLDNHLSHVKKLVVSNVEKDAIEKAIVKLDQKIERVLKNEGKIMSYDLKNNVGNEDIKLKVMELEKKLDSKLERFEKHDEEKVNALQNNMSALREQFSYYLQMKEERDQRMQELEERIRQQSQANTDEIAQIESQIAMFQQKFDQVSSQLLDWTNPNNKEEHMTLLSRLQERLDSLKTKLFMKKTGMTEEQHNFISDAPIQQIRERPKLNNLPPISANKEFSFKNPNIKHDLKMDTTLIDPLRDTTTAKPGELPPLPPLPKMPESVKKKYVEK